MAGPDLGHGFGCSLGDDPAAMFAAVGAEVEDPVGAFDDIHIVLDDDEGVAGLAQLHEDLQKGIDVGDVETGGGFVEDVEGLGAAAFGQFGGELDPLGFAAGKGAGGLSEREVAESDFLHGGEFVGHGGHGAEKRQGFVDGHVQHIGDVFAFVGDLEGLAVVAATVADVAGDEDVGEEMHFDFERAVALAMFAASAFDVEAEASGVVAADTGGGDLREKFADGAEGTGVGGGIGARGASDGRLVDHDEAVDLSGTEDGVVRAGCFLGAVEVAGQGGAEDVVDEGGFAAAGNTGDADEAAEREMGVDVLQVVFAGPGDAEPAVGGSGHERARGEGRLAFGGDADAEFAGEVASGERLRRGGDFGERALGHDFSAERSGAGADVDEVVGGGDGVVIVLDDEDGVAEVTEAFERGDEAFVVALVEADARFVEHVEDAGESAADLRGQADALRFAARERSAFAVEGEVAETDFLEESEAAGDFLHDLAGDGFLPALPAEIFHDVRGAGDGEIAEGVDAELGAVVGHEGDREHFGPEAGAAAAGAGAAVLQGFEALAEGFAFGARKEVLQLGEEALEGFGDVVARGAGAESEFDGAVTGAVEQEFAEGGREFAQRDVGADPGILRQRGGEGGVVSLHFRRAFAPRDNGAVLEGFLGVEDEVRIEIRLGAESLTTGARAEVAVEREVLGGEARQGETGARVGERGGERVVGEFAFAGCLHRGDQPAFAPAQGRLDGIGEALAESGFEHEAVDDGFDVVAALFVEADFGFPVEVGDGAVDPRAHEALAAQFFDDVAELAGLAADDGGEEDELAFGREGQDGVGDFLRGLPADDLAGLGVMRHAEGGIKDAEVVVDFGGGGDGRAGPGGGGALLDGDGRRESFDEVHVGALEAVEELAGVRGKAFDVFALAFGVEGVEGEGRFAGAAGAGEDDELVAGDGDVDVLEIVLARAFDADGGGLGGNHTGQPGKVSRRPGGAEADCGPWQGGGRGYGGGVNRPALPICLGLLLGAASLRADFDLRRVPTAQDVAAIRATGWAAAADALEAGLAAEWKPSHAAQAGSSGNAIFRQWQLLCQWCRLLGTPEPEALRAWLGRRVLRDPEKENTLLVVPPGMALPTDRSGRPLPTATEQIDVGSVSPGILQALLPSDYTRYEGAVAGRATEDFLAELAGDQEFLREFFRELKPDDFTPVVLMRLAQLRRAHPGAWPAYRPLMLAFALVWDQREPSFWPHHQVPAEAVPRTDEDVAERFEYFYRANEARKLEHDVRRLSVGELKFLVDAPVPRSELEWAAKNVRGRRDQFDRVFESVRYDVPRAEKGAFMWPHGSYRLGNIELHGGICTDQAYFASVAGKAKGIPTLYFAGQGSDGGHAWFGFLRGNGKWELDAGRYQNQNYTVGQALDPQTWLPITDHELLYLSGRAVRTPTHDAALGDLAMADVFARRGDTEAAGRAAESARFHAPNSVAAWEAKERVLAGSGNVAALRAHYAAAIDQFRREEDLRVRYQTRLAELEREAGDGQAARELETRMIRENRRERTDLSTAAGAEVLTRLAASGDYEAAMREYRALTGRLGPRGGGNFFYDVVRPFVLQLRGAGREKDARRALDLAGRVMRFERGSILEREFAELQKELPARQ